MLEIILKLQKKALPCCCCVLRAGKTIDLQKNYSLALWICSFPHILYLYWFGKEILLQVGRGSSMLHMSECTAYWLPRWTLCHGLLLLTLVMCLGALTIASSSKWPVRNNRVVLNGCKIIDWKLQAKSVVLCWHPMLKVDGHQCWSCSSLISWLTYQV